MQKGWYCFCSPEPRVNLASGQCWAACKVECALSGNTHVLQPVLGGSREMVVWLTLEERASSVSGSPFARRLRGSCRASSGSAVAHTRVDDGS